VHSRPCNDFRDDFQDLYIPDCHTMRLQILRKSSVILFVDNLRNHAEPKDSKPNLSGRGSVRSHHPISSSSEVKGSIVVPSSR
jgi:hypothetical protein